MTEGHTCNHCRKFFTGTPYLKGTFKRPDIESYVRQFTLCEGCAEFIVPTSK